MRLDPLNTTTGKYIEKTSLSIMEEIIKYDILSNDDLGYEYSSDATKFIFITGKNDEEKKIPIFKLPIINTEGKDKAFIAVDLREFISIKDDFDTLEEVLIKKSAYTLPLFFALLTADYLDKGNFNEFKLFYYTTLQTVLVNRLSSLLSLDSEDSLTLSIVITSYLVNVVEGQKDDDVKDFIITNNIMFGKIEISKIEYVHSLINREADTIDELVKNIKTSSDTNRLKNLDKEVLLNIFSNSFFRSHSYEAFVGLEAPMAWLSLVYLYNDKNIYSKTNLVNILSKYKRKFKLDDTIKNIDNIVKQFKK